MFVVAALGGRIRFASAGDRGAFVAELTDAVIALVSRYHDESAPGGREHGVIAAVYTSVGRASTMMDSTETKGP